MSEQTEALLVAKLWAAGKMAGGDAYKVASVLAKQVEALQAENEGLRKDAERYRWLQSQYSEELHAFAEMTVSEAENFIDTAIAKQK